MIFGLTLLFTFMAIAMLALSIIILIKLWFGLIGSVIWFLICLISSALWFILVIITQSLE